MSATASLIRESVRSPRRSIFTRPRSSTSRLSSCTTLRSGMVARSIGTVYTSGCAAMSMPPEVGDREGERAEDREARALFLAHEARELLEVLRDRPSLLPAVLGLAVRMLVRGVLRRARARSGMDVVLVDRLRHATDGLVAKAKRLRDLAARRARLIGHDVAHHRRVALAVLLVHILDDLLAVVRRDVEVDVRHRATVLGEEALEEGLGFDRSTLGDFRALG